MKWIVYKKTDVWYIEWQRGTTNGNECHSELQRVVQQLTTNVQLTATNDNEWQRMKTSDNECYNEWQKVTTSGKGWQEMAMSDSEWEHWYSEWKRHSTLQRMDNCHHFNDKKRNTTTSRDGWLQLERLNK